MKNGWSLLRAIIVIAALNATALRADEETVIKNDTDAAIAIDSASLGADASVPAGETRWLKVGSGITNEKWILRGSGSKPGSVTITNGYTNYVTCVVGATDAVVAANRTIFTMPVLQSSDTLTITTPASDWELDLRVARPYTKLTDPDMIIEDLAQAIKNNQKGVIVWLEKFVRAHSAMYEIKDWVIEKDAHGNTRLMRAIQNNNMARVRFFVAARGDIDAVNEADYLMVLFGRDMEAEGSPADFHWYSTHSYSLPNYEEAKQMSQFASVSMGVGSEGNEFHIFTGGKTALDWAKYFERTEMYNFLKAQCQDTMFNRCP